MRGSIMAQINLKKAFLLTGCSAAAMLTSSAALAQRDEIIVSATKRDESIQEVPLAISAYTGEFVRDANLDDIKDLVKFTPGVSGNSLDSFIDFLNIRGIRTNDFGVGGDPSIPLFKNGLYQGRNGAAVSSLFDMERAEVLRGPQGFLFGRNAIGGAISVHTAKPRLDEYSGYAELDVGERDRIFGEAALNLPVNEFFALRISGYGAHEDGYVENVARPGIDKQVEPEKYAGRLSALYSKDAFEALFTVEYEKRMQSGALYRATEKGDSWDTLVDVFGLSLGGTPNDIDSDQGLGEADNGEILSFGLQLDYDLGGAIISSITGYKDHSYFYAEDFDGTPLRINDYSQDQEGSYFEQELRVVSDNDGPLSWYAGASYYNEEIDVLFTQAADEEVMCQYYLSYYGINSCTEYFAYYYYSFTPNPDGLVESNQVRGRYHGFAAYVDATWQLSEQFDIGVGLRYSRDTKKFGIRALPVDSQLGPYFALGFTSADFHEAKQSWDAFTPRFMVRYHPSDNVMLFASATRGFKAGGFGSFTVVPNGSATTYCGPFSTDCINLAAGDASPDTFDPEKAWSYEAGFKGTAFGGRSRIDGNVYYYTYKDLQQTVAGTGGGIVVENIGNVKGWGIEGSIDTDLGEYFGILLSGSYLGTEATNVQSICDGTDDCEGLSLANVPKFSGAGVLRMNVPAGAGEIYGAAEFTAQSKTYGGAAHLDEAITPSLFDMALRLGYKAEAGWSVIGYVENVTDQDGFAGAEESGGIIPAHFVGPIRPRTFGVRMSYEWGG
ncbi:TonB-dependent receptor [Hyphococcus sp. DH-69]|uniref:TonB-dependent receptor n=1 Tax=Hyphococcus formosus TaxID=3143534 RepID=UPI00398B333E